MSELAAAPPATTAQASSSSLVLHHLDNSRSQRILWLLEALEVPYEIKYYKRLPTKQAPPELKAVHPLGKSPVITDKGSDGSIITIAESGAIVEYLIAKYGNGRFQAPKEGQGYIDNLYFTHYAEGSVMPMSVLSYIMQLVPEHSPMLMRPLTRAVCNGIQNNLVQPQLKMHQKLVEDHLAKCTTGWFANGPEPTSADFMMIFPCEGLKKRAESECGPKISEYLDRVHALPAWKRGVEKGGQYDMA